MILLPMVWGKHMEIEAKTGLVQDSVSRIG
jgi:hypothetical protein